jgi:anti-anti-sigma regulatory factor
MGRPPGRQGGSMMVSPCPRASLADGHAPPHTGTMADADPSLTAVLAQASYRSSGLGANQVLACRFADGCLTLRVEGSSSDALPDRLAQGVKDAFATLKPRRAAIDVSACQTLPSVVLAFLVYFQKTADEHGVPKVVLYGVSPRVATVLKMIGMADFFATVADEAAMKKWYDDRNL